MGAPGCCEVQDLMGSGSALYPRHSAWAAHWRAVLCAGLCLLCAGCF